VPELVGGEFPKPRSGRPVRADISYLKEHADKYPGEVVADNFTEKDAQSVRRQFLKMSGYKVMTSKTDESDMRRVYVMRKN
jgi:hypothetical protein